MSDEKMRAEFEVYMRDVVKCVVGSSDPYPAGIERREWVAWQASRTAQSEAKPTHMFRQRDGAHYTAQNETDASELEQEGFERATPAPVKPAESNEDAIALLSKRGEV